MRKTLTAAVTVAALAGWLWRISPLPPKRGNAVCFAAGYNPPRPIDLSSPRREKRSVGEVSSMQLEISLAPDEHPYRDKQSGRDYDWRYSLRLKASLTDGRRLSTITVCEWTDSSIDRIMPALLCYIDCDGAA